MLIEGPYIAIRLGDAGMSQKEIVLDALKKMPEDVSFDAISEQIAVLAAVHGKPKSAIPHAPDFAGQPVFGMWADRVDMKQSPHNGGM